MQRLKRDAGKLRQVKIHLLFYWMLAGVILTGTVTWLSLWGTQVSQDWVTLQQNPTDATKKKFDASLEVVKVIVGGAGTISTHCK